ncbi:hypothetical protein CU663_15485 [Pseudomonas syringae pv. actinidifoliorum]|nr:hypothetical protein [Pseudomonas syringae pv. actinidifoliorum]
MNNTFIHRMQMPEFTGTYFLGEQGERGNSPYLRGFKPFPLIECMGNRGHKHVFEYKSVSHSAHLVITVPRFWVGYMYPL